VRANFTDAATACRGHSRLTRTTTPTDDRAADEASANRL
jgi:hypothetical protein